MNVTTRDVFVKFVPPDGNPSIAEYQGNLKNGAPSEICSVDAGVEPLGCIIGDLKAATEYTIQARGCLPHGVGCSENREKMFWTRPQSKQPIATVSNCNQFSNQ